ncbi:MAG: Gfo/Idh/MocA family oxidoreductase [Terriglobia bacterium]|jgi:predicted dehydrogenase
MSSRRTFIKETLGGSAALVASGFLPSSSVLGANDRIRFALIGGGGRGKEIFHAALQCPNVEAVAVADVYTRRLDEIKAIVPNIKTYQDFRKILDDPSIDAVLIASPQHIHCLQFVPALAAGKDVYQEKTMAFNPDHARRMRRAFEKSDRVVQVGIQVTSAPGYTVIREMVTPEKMGEISALHTHHYRNRRNGGWLRQIPPDCDADHVDWKGFEGEATHYPFDPQRLINWRFYWDYDGSNVYENMVHQVGFWYKVMDFKIPDSVTMTGANFLSPKMQMPDTMDVSMRQGNVLFTWNSMFGNDFYGEGHDMLLGTKGMIARNEGDQVRYLPEGGEGRGVETLSSVSPQGGQARGYYEATNQHMQNFFDCMRSRKEPHCPFEIGYRSAIACQMAIASYHQKRTITWDPKTEDIV